MKEFIEKLIGRLEEESYFLPQVIKGDADAVVDIGDIKEITNQLAEEYKGGWIPVEQRLPIVGMTVLCYWKQEDRYTNMTSYYYTLMHRNEDCQWISDFGMCNGIVLAWMPLPEPFKPKGE